MDHFAAATTNSSSHGSNSNFSSMTKNNTKDQNKKIITKGKSKGVKLSTDPQSVAARERRHRISDRFKILQSLVPGGTKMDTVSMLEEAICYVKFLKTQIWLHQNMINFVDDDEVAVDPSMFNYLPAHHLQQQQQDHFNGQGRFLGGVASVHPTPQGVNVPLAEYPTVPNNVEAYMKYFS